MKLSAETDFGDYMEMNDKEKVAYLWSKYIDEDGLDPVFYYTFIKDIDHGQISRTDILKLHKIEREFGNKKIGLLSQIELSDEDALIFASEIKLHTMKPELSSESLKKISEAEKYIKNISSYEPLTKEEILDLYLGENGFNSFKNGKYAEGIKLFLFCRHNRKLPCLFVMKDRNNQTVRNADGSLWTLPALAHSRRELPFNVTNGQTPQGIYTMDSVMPQPNNPKAYGKWRRVILDFIPKSKDENLTLSLLPRISENSNWWKQASLARDIGRNSFRIHGTGNINQDSESSFYTFYATSGCISTQENNYDGIEYQGQRILLDKMMETMSLQPVYENEVKINGLLYVVELDDAQTKVTEEALREFDIY